MKKQFYLWAFTLLLGGGLVAYDGCSTSASSTAYKTETAVDTSVVVAWNLWTNYVVTAQVSSKAQVPVVTAFNKIKAVELVVIDATAAAAATTNSASVSAGLAAALTTAESQMTQDLSDLGALLATFNIKL